ncbi:hypothetical protein [Cryobacterium sp. Y57]|uniref:aggregation-promoting factor C-terminal-like domain-containing protein n=1 Tax=Cryobacterium sp. Y57 TaxID=2048287 RepID=UPI001304B7A8|nr:hypothetical protein [Cryobacterium sp. Y57]
MSNQNRPRDSQRFVFLKARPISSSTTPTTPLETDASRTQTTRRRRSRKRSRFLAAGAITAIAAVVGTGFAVQSSIADENARTAVMTALASSGAEHVEQLELNAGRLRARAEQASESAVSGASVVIAAAEGKTDATDLSASVASLSPVTLLAPERIFELVDVTTTETANVNASTTEVDRVAAEQAAVAQASAEAAAAEAAVEAAAEAAAAEAEAGDAVPAAPARPSAPTDPNAAQQIARQLMANQYGWGDDQFGCLVSLWEKESRWNVNAYNASSGATGIPQALPGNKMASAGADWQTNPATQISWGLGYIASRYSTPCDAWDKSEASGWY